MNFLKEQLFYTCPLPTTKLSGRTAIVTGANIGLGYETAVHFARLDAKRIIIACRTVEKGETAKNKLLESVPAYAGTVEVWQLDLASFKSVKAFATRISELDRLDILVENAGVATERWDITEDGYESTLQINDLATGLLGVLALPALAKTAKLPIEGSSPFKPHLAIVGSEVHFWASFPQQQTPGSILEALNDQKQHTPKDRYNVSKLLNVFIAREIAALPVAKDTIVVNVINPGLCVSELRRDINGSFLGWALDSLARTGEEGARNIAWAATEETSPGAYVSVCSEKPPSAYSTSEQGLAMQKKVWEEMVVLFKKESPEVATILA